MSETRSNVVPFGSTPRRGSGNGGGDGTSERLARLEERVNHLATSSDLEKVVTNVEKLRGEVGILKWICGLIAGGVGLIAAGVIVALFKLFGS